MPESKWNAKALILKTEVHLKRSKELKDSPENIKYYEEVLKHLKEIHLIRRGKSVIKQILADTQERLETLKTNIK